MQSDGNSFGGQLALTWYTVKKTLFKTKNMKNESFGNLIMKISIFKSDRRICFAICFDIVGLKCWLQPCMLC